MIRLFSGDRSHLRLDYRCNRPAPCEDAEPGPILVYRTPKMVQHAVDSDAELRLSRAQRSPKVGAEFQAPMPAAFVGHMVAGFEQDQLDVARTGLKT